MTLTEADLCADDIADLEARRVGALLRRHRRTSLTIDGVLTLNGRAWPGGHHLYADLQHRQIWPDGASAREGWRIWVATSEGRLHSGFTRRSGIPVTVEDGVVRGVCPFQHAAFAACACGIRYVPDVADFGAIFEQVTAGLSAHGNELPDGWYPVAAYGTAVGDIDYDIERFGDGYRLSPRHMRCEQFSIAKLLRIDDGRWN